jgi:D-aspartate ligase
LVGTLREKQIGDNSVPVVIMHSYHYYALGIARSLGRLGIQVYGIIPYRRSPAAFSRYFQKIFLLNTAIYSPQEMLDYLGKISEVIGKRAIVIPTSDEDVLLLAQNADYLSDKYIFPSCSPKLISLLTNKNELFRLAKAHGILSPETRRVNSIDDVEYALKDLNFPIIAKSIHSTVALNKKFLFKTRAELKAAFNEKCDNFIFQEYIPGHTWMFNGYFNISSDCLFEMTGKKLRQNPLESGCTSLGVCIDNSKVASITKQFMKELNYSGPLDVDYVYDKRDDSYKILDVNPRVGATFRLFKNESGMDVLRAEYLYLTGQLVPKGKAVEGRKWIVEDYDLLSSLSLFRSGALKVKDWSQSLRGIQEAGYFASDDPLPFFAMIGGLVNNARHI